MSIDVTENPAKSVLAERRILALLSILQALKIPDGSAIIADAPGGLYEFVSRACGLRVKRYASRVILERFGYWVESWLKPASLNEALLTPEVQNAVLAEHTGRLAYYFPVEAGQELSPPPNITVHIESISGAILNSNNPVLIALNDIEPIVALANQAEECLADFRPVLMLSLNGVPEKILSLLFIKLESLGYFICNELLEPFIYQECEDPVEPLHCIALHPAVVSLPDVNKLEEILKPTHSLSRLEKLCRNTLLSEYVPKQAEWLRTAFTDGLWSLPLEGISSQNWYGVEYDNQDRWRWLGPGSEARMLINLPAMGDYLLELGIRHVADSNISKGTKFFVNGQLVPVFEAGLKPGQRLLLPFSVGAENWSGWAVLLVALPQTVRLSQEDPRSFGISINQLSLRWRDA